MAVDVGGASESTLIVWARTLRAQIEDPGHVEAVEDQTMAASTPLLTTVREHLLAAEPGSSQWAVLFG